jgi:hypothetical protein
MSTKIDGVQFVCPHCGCESLEMSEHGNTSIYAVGDVTMDGYCGDWDTGEPIRTDGDDLDRCVQCAECRHFFDYEELERLVGRQQGDDDPNHEED